MPDPHNRPNPQDSLRHPPLRALHNLPSRGLPLLRSVPLNRRPNKLSSHQLHPLRDNSILSTMSGQG